MTKVFILIFIATLWGNIGQILYKNSINSLEPPNLRSLKSYLSFISKFLSIPAIWLGMSSIVVGILIWLVALAQTQLSIAFPLDSMQYVVTLVTAHIFLNEKINRLKLTGTLLVVAGIILVALS